MSSLASCHHLRMNQILVVSVAEIFPQDFVIIQTEAETADCIA
jgi:hypothetical protein